jgi:anti-sigma factor RsiW
MLIRRNDDELISAYVDGQLNERERQAFEARMAADPSLRRRVEATRLLVQAARELPPVPLPRNFTLPKSAGAPQRAAPSATWWRLGSALAAAVFVIAIGLDVSGSLSPRAAAPTTASAPNAAAVPPGTQTFAATQLPAGTTAAGGAAQPAAGSAAESASPTEAPVQATPPAMKAAPTDGANGGAAESGGPPPQPQATPAPQVQSASPVTPSEEMTAGVLALGVAPTATAPEIGSRQQLTESQVITAPYSANVVTEAQGVAAANVATATEMTAVSDAALATGTPEATTAPALTTVPAPEVAPPPAAPPNPAPATPWLRIVALVSLLAALGLGALGWLRR